MEKTILLEMKGISKKFGRTIANEDVNLRLYKGEIHALLGENGAGKSTLMNILLGIYKPNAGEIYTKGEKVSIKTPKDAAELGIGMVHQHFQLIPTLSVAENVYLSLQNTRFLLNKPKMEETIKGYSEKFNLPVDPGAKIWQLSVGEQQRVEIMKILCRNSEILILDEPSAVLTPQEAREMFKTLRKMAQEGKSVIFISHKMNEVMENADRITVLKGGRIEDEMLAEDATIDRLTKAVIGKRNADINIDKNAERSIERNPDKYAERSLESNPDRNAVRSIERNPDRNPDRNAVRSIERNPDRNPDRNAVRSIERNPDRNPDKNAVRSIERNPDKNPDRNPDKNAVRNPDKNTYEDTNKSTEKDIDKTLFKSADNSLKKAFDYNSNTDASKTSQDTEFKILLKATNICAKNDKGLIALNQISFELKTSEIFGIAGVAGSGQRELAEVLAGLRKAASGTLKMRGKDITKAGARHRIAEGISFIPEDRLHMGLVPAMNMKQNAILKDYKNPRFSRRGILRKQSIKELTENNVRTYEIKNGGMDLPVSLMSGGNQQKLLVAREIQGNPALLIAAYPVRGLDIGATEAIHNILREQRERGACVLLISEELDELFALSDRIGVLCDGKLMGIRDRDKTNYEEIGRMMSGETN